MDRERAPSHSDWERIKVTWLNGGNTPGQARWELSREAESWASSLFGPPRFLRESVYPLPPLLQDKARRVLEEGSVGWKLANSSPYLQGRVEGASLRALGRFCCPMLSGNPSGPEDRILLGAFRAKGFNRWFSNKEIQKANKHIKILNISSQQGIKAKLQWDIPSSLSPWLKSKTQTVTNAAKDVDKGEHLYTVGGNVISAVTVENRVEISLKKQKIYLPYDLAITLPGIYPKVLNTMYQRDTCTIMWIAALFTTARIWNQPRWPSSDVCIKKMWYIYTVEYYSAMKRNDILPFAKKWTQLEDFTLSKINRTQKDKYYMFSLICGS